MHVEYTLKIIGGKLALEVDSFIIIEFVPRLVDGEEESEFSGVVKEVDGFGRKDATEIG